MKTELITQQETWLSLAPVVAILIQLVCVEGKQSSSLTQTTGGKIK